MTANTNTLDWGCTSYEKTCAVVGSRKEYIARFMAERDTSSYETVRITFWASRPVIAIGVIVGSRRNPLDFDGKILN